MKLFAAALGAWLAVTVAAQADLVIVQKVDGAGQAGEQTIKIKEGKSRTDLTPQVSMITDNATGESVTLMHPQRAFLKISSAQAKAMMEQLRKLRPDGPPPQLQPTGKKEKIGEYECEIFTANLGALTATYWIAKDFPNYQAILAQLEKFQSGGISAMGQGVMPELKDFPGMMMKTEINLGGKKVVTTILSAKEENVDPAIFKIPTNYKETSSPTLSFPAK